jgi:hypothetical protein
MQFLADENVPRPIVRWLRSQGHDVLYAAETRAQTSDADLLSEAEAQSVKLCLNRCQRMGEPGQRCCISLSDQEVRVARSDSVVQLLSSL